MKRFWAALTAAFLISTAPAGGYAADSAAGQAVRRGAFYAPREYFHAQSAAAGENIGYDVRFALSAEGDLLLYSNDRERLYLFNGRGATLKTLDLRAENFAAGALLAADVATRPGGGCYIIEADGRKAIVVSGDFKVTSFASWHDRFSPGRLFAPAFARCDAAGNLLVYESVQGVTRFFSAAGLLPGAAFDGMAVPASDRSGHGELFCLNPSGATLEINLVSAAGARRFASCRFEGLADALFMAERSPAGGVVAGVRIIVNDRFEYRIVETDAAGTLLSNLPVKFAGGAPRKALMDAAGKILTVLPGGDGARGAVVMELVKTTPAGE